MQMIDMKRPGEKTPSSSRPDSRAESVQTPQREPSSHSEVQTKLELARQFIDMGDPESARHMLGEVIEEGDSVQKQEAQSIVDSLP
jgi:pilus assembly protein FimV